MNAHGVWGPAGPGGIRPNAPYEVFGMSDGRLEMTGANGESLPQQPAQAQQCLMVVNVG
jgi:hypothetical protein